MAEEDASEDRTEEPTSRRLQKAREDGDTAKSNEVTAAAVMIVTAVYFQLYGGVTADQIKELFGSGFIFDQKILHAGMNLPAIFAEQIGRGYLAVLPVLAITLLAAVAASGITGGYLFSVKAAAPNLGKLNILSGLQRMLGLKTLVELGKTVVKFVLVTTAVTWIVSDNLLALINLGSMSVEPAVSEAATLIVRSTLLITLSFVAIGLLDFLYQRHSFTKRMRMSKQEVRDEIQDQKTSTGNGDFKDDGESQGRGCGDYKPGALCSRPFL
jgi:flagellar biosynthesis protein FlhB